MKLRGALAFAAATQHEYPDHAVKIVVPFALGIDRRGGEVGPRRIHILLMGTTGVPAINNYLYKDMRFDPQRDFASS